MDQFTEVYTGIVEGHLELLKFAITAANVNYAGMNYTSGKISQTKRSKLLLNT